MAYRPNKIIWTRSMTGFIKRNYSRMTNKELAAGLGLNLCTVRTKCIEMGLKRMELEYWTDKQVQALTSLYKHIGDKEIAMIFSEAYPKKKGWTLKHIEKKRMYLGLKRTPIELKAIRQRNKAFGCWKVGSVHTWQTRGEAPIGTIKVWSNGPNLLRVQKTECGYQKLGRATWQKAFGPIPKGMNVVRKELSKSEGDINNLELITNAELGQRNSMYRYPVEVQEAIKTLNKLNKAIYEKQNRRCA